MKNAKKGTLDGCGHPPAADGGESSHPVPRSDQEDRHLQKPPCRNAFLPIQLLIDCDFDSLVGLGQWNESINFQSGRHLSLKQDRSSNWSDLCIWINWNRFSCRRSWWSTRNRTVTSCTTFSSRRCSRTSSAVWWWSAPTTSSCAKRRGSSVSTSTGSRRENGTWIRPFATSKSLEDPPTKKGSSSASKMDRSSSTSWLSFFAFIEHPTDFALRSFKRWDSFTPVNS